MENRKQTVESVIRACQLLRCFDGQTTLRLTDLEERTGLSKTTCFRLLKSLEVGGLIEKKGRGTYSRVSLDVVKIGYAAQTSDSEFARDVSEGIRLAAAKANVLLIEKDNHYNPEIAVQQADELIRAGVRLVLEFQTYESVAHTIGDKFSMARIPVIAIEIPHTGAVFFGANNMEAGKLGGEALGAWAKENWSGEVDELLLLELGIAGSEPQMRIMGIKEGLAKELPEIKRCTETRLDGNGDYEESFKVVWQYLSERKERKRTLVAAVNDPSALGALKAFEDAKRLQYCAVMGQNAIRSARDELRKEGTRLVGSVAYFPEKYGEKLIPLALRLLQKEQDVKRVNRVAHKLVTPKNVDSIYPDD